MSSFMHTSCTSLTTLTYLTILLEFLAIQSLETAVRQELLSTCRRCSSNTLTDDADVNGALLTTLLQSIASHCAELSTLGPISDNNLGLPGLCSVVENIPLRLNHIDLKSTHLTNSFHSVSQYTVTSEMLESLPKKCLTSLYLTGSNFSGMAGTLLLAKFLQAFQSLEKLICFDCSLTSADIIMLIHHLKSANVICKNLK